MRQSTSPRWTGLGPASLLLGEHCTPANTRPSTSHYRCMCMIELRPLASCLAFPFFLLAHIPHELEGLSLRVHGLSNRRHACQAFMGEVIESDGQHNCCSISDGAQRISLAAILHTSIPRIPYCLVILGAHYSPHTSCKTQSS